MGERANDLANALTWMRKRGIDRMSEESLADFNKQSLEEVTTASPESPSKDVENILNWLRNKTDDDSLDQSGVLQILESSLPTTEGQPLEERAQDLANVLD